MAVLNFPASPTNGQQYTENNVVYTYSGTHPNGFWLADNKNVLPPPSPDLDVSGTLTLSGQTGSGTAIATIDANGDVARGDLTTDVVGPFALKSGDTFTGNVLLDSSARLGVGSATPTRQIEVEAATAEIELNSTSGNSALVFNVSGTDKGAIQYDNTNDQIEFYTTNYTGNPEAILDSSGNLGVGGAPSARIEAKGDSGLALDKGDSSRRYTITPVSGLTFTETVGGTTLATATSAGLWGFGATPSAVSPYDNLVVGSATETAITIKSDDDTAAILNFAGASTSTGRIKFTTSTDELAFVTNNTDRVVVTSAGNVGVNKAVPTAKVHVDGGSGTGAIIEGNGGAHVKHASGSDLFLGSGDGTNTVIGSANNTSTAIQTNGTVRFTVDNVGDVDAESSSASPLFKFHSPAGGDAAGSGFCVIPNASAASRKAQLVLDPNGGDFTGSDYYSLDVDGNNFVEYISRVGTAQAFKFGTTEAARFTSNNELLIGTTTTKDGALVVHSTNKSGVSFTNGNTTDGFFVGSNTTTDAKIWNTENAPLLIGTNDTEQVRVAAGGSVLIGTTAESSFNRPLQIGDATDATADIELRSSTTGGIRFSTANTSAGLGAIEYAHSGNTLTAITNGTSHLRVDSDGRFSTFSTNATANILSSSKVAGSSDKLLEGYAAATGLSGAGGVATIAVYTNGNIENTNNSYGALSDAKLKTNITDANSQWDDIKNVSLKNFDFKPSVGVTGPQLGVIAQEIELISPGLVESHEDTEIIESPVFDENGNAVLDAEGNQVTEIIEQKTGGTTLSVKYSVLYLKALGALQEAMTRIESLESRIAELES